MSKNPRYAAGRGNGNMELALTCMLLGVGEERARFSELGSVVGKFASLGDQRLERRVKLSKLGIWRQIFTDNFGIHIGTTLL